MKKIVKVVDKTKPEISICHLADVHLGYRRYNRLTRTGQNQREMDINIAFQESITRIIKLSPDLVIIAGDLFHHVRPTNSVLGFCFREIKRLAHTNQIPVIIVAGNHEFPKRQDTGCALSILAEIDNVFIADQKMEKFVFEEKSLSVTCLPQPSLTELKKGQIRADDKYKHNILALHAQIGKQHVSDFGGVEIDFSSLSPFEWDYIALGHLHEMKEIGHNACYSGSLEHTATNIWSEAKSNKGFLQIALPEGKRIFHPLTSPREIMDLESIEADKLESAEVSELIENRLSNVPGGLEGKIVRLEVNNITRNVQANLNHKKIREYRSRALNLTLDFKPPFMIAQPSSIQFDKPKKLEHELSEYCDSLAESAEQKAEIKNLLLSYLVKVEEKHEVVKSEP